MSKLLAFALVHFAGCGPSLAAPNGTANTFAMPCPGPSPRTDAPSQHPTAPLNPASTIDLAWIVGAEHVLLRQTTGTLVTSDEVSLDLWRSAGRFYGVATAGGRDPYGVFTAKMWKIDIDAESIDADLGVLAGAELGRPNPSKIIVDGSDSYLSWSITIEDAETCKLGSCRPGRSVRLTSRPDGQGFYHWFAWTGLEPVALDRKKPDAAAAALLARFPAPP